MRDENAVNEEDIQGYAFGGIANPGQRAVLRASDQAYMADRLREMEAYEAQRQAYNTGLEKYKTEVYQPYQDRAQAYNTVAEKYNTEVFQPYQRQFEEYQKAIQAYNEGDRQTDYSGPSAPVLGSKFELEAPVAPAAFSMTAPTAPFREEDVATRQTQAENTARSDAQGRALAIDVVSDPNRFNFGGLSISNAFMAQGGPVDSGSSARGMLAKMTGAVAGAGRRGDTELAYLSPGARSLLAGRGGSNTVNPLTGLREFYSTEGLTKDEIFRTLKSVGYGFPGMVPYGFAGLFRASDEQVTAAFDAARYNKAAQELATQGQAAEMARLVQEAEATRVAEIGRLRAAEETRAVADRARTEEEARVSAERARQAEEARVLQVEAERAKAAEDARLTEIALGVRQQEVAREDLVRQEAQAAAAAAANTIRVREAQEAAAAAAYARRVRDPQSVVSAEGREGRIVSPIAPPAARSDRVMTPLRPVDVSDRVPRIARPATREEPRTVVPAIARAGALKKEESSSPSTAEFIDYSTRGIGTARDISLPVFSNRTGGGTGAAADMNNFFALNAGANAQPGLTPGTVALAPLDLPLEAAQRTLDEINKNPNLTPGMLGGRENAGYQTDRLGNRIYSPGAIRTFNTGGEVEEGLFKANAFALADEDDTTSADLTGSAKALLANLTNTTKVSAPNIKSIKRSAGRGNTGKTASLEGSAAIGGPTKGMDFTYESLFAAKDVTPLIKEQGSAREQMEALARAYKLKAQAATNKARGLSQDTMGYPTLEKPTLLKGRLTSKRFEKGGEVTGTVTLGPTTIRGTGPQADVQEQTEYIESALAPTAPSDRSTVTAADLLEEAKNVARRTVSLDPQPDAGVGDFIVDTVGGFIPGVGQALSARDFERARRDDDKLGMGLAAASFIPFGKATSAVAGISRAPGGYFPTSRIEGGILSNLDKSLNSVLNDIRQIEDPAKRQALTMLFNQKAKDFYTKQAGSIEDPLRKDILSGALKFERSTPMGDVFPQVLQKGTAQGDLEALRLLEKSYDNMLGMGSFVPRVEGTPEINNVMVSQIMANMKANLNKIPDAQLLAYAGKKPGQGPTGVADVAGQIRQKLKDNPTLFSTILEPRIAETLFVQSANVTDNAMARYPRAYGSPASEAMTVPGARPPESHRDPVDKGFFLPEMQMAIEKGQPVQDIILNSNRLLGMDPERMLSEALQMAPEEINKMSFPDFLKKAYANTQQLAQFEKLLPTIGKTIKAGKVPSSEVMMYGIKDFLPTKDFRWVKVIKPDGVQAIAEGMNNSVGRYAKSNTYGSLDKGRAALESGQAEIYALYDKNNLPHVTVEYVTDKLGVPDKIKNTITQLTGNGPLTRNDFPGKYGPQIVDLLNKLRPDKVPQGIKEFLELTGQKKFMTEEVLAPLYFGVPAEMLRRPQ